MAKKKSETEELASMAKVEGTGSEGKTGIYGKLEDKFFDLCDALDSKGIPVYSVVDFMENHGIPAFPFTIAIIVIILALIFGFVFIGTTTDATIGLQIYDQFNEPLSAVTIIVKDSSGNQIFGPQTFSSGGSIDLGKKPIGIKLTVQGTKDGYDSYETDITIKDKEAADATLILKKKMNLIIGTIELIDSETRTRIDDAQIVGEWKNQTFYARFSDGIYQLQEIPSGETIDITITAPDYETEFVSKTFTEGQTYTIPLTPSGFSLQGESSLVVTVKDKSNGELLTDVKVKIFDAITNELLNDFTIEDGIFAQNIEKGKVIRLTAEKEDYVTYDASIEGKTLTLRGEEEQWLVELARGGETLLVTVLEEESGLPVINAEVQLFNSENNLIDSSKTDISGTLEFSGLDPNTQYYITAFKAAYVPKRISFTPLNLKQLEIRLQLANATNSGVLKISVKDSTGNIAVNAVLQFFEITSSGEILPLGVPNKTTDLSGKATVSEMPIGKTVLVKASKGIESGEAEKTISSGENNLEIQLEKPITVKILTIKDETGNLIDNAHVVITSRSGEILFDGNSSKGIVEFDSLGNRYVSVKVTTLDGKGFEEEIDFSGKEETAITVSDFNENGLSPDIKLVEITDLSGEKVEGITKEEEYILKFEINWPKNAVKGGLHVRIGDDAVRFVDSQYSGITGFEASTAKFFYGKSFTPIPSPGNEAIDFSNKGKAGSYNKFLELYFDNPNAKIIAKIKIKVKETFKGESIPIHFRAWNEVKGEFYRIPADEELGTDRFTESKTGLYAKTIDAEVKVFSAKSACEQDVCVNFVFADKAGAQIDSKDFFALKGKVYALEMEIVAGKAITPAIKFSTSKEEPKIYFTGIQKEPFSSFIENENTDTALEEKELTVLKNNSKKLRVYFKAVNEGQASIKIKTITDESSLDQDFYFNVFEEKQMTVELSSSVVGIGEDFLVTVLDNEGNGLENAKLFFKDKSGKQLKLMTGDGSSGDGKNGKYSVKNSFSAGTITIRVEAEKFAPVETEIEIASTKGLELKEKIFLNIPKGVKKQTIQEQISNSLSADISNISYELDKEQNFPNGLNLTVALPGKISAKKTETMQLTAEYSGDLERVHGELDLIVSGQTTVGMVAKKSRVIIDFNKKLDESCLEIVPDSLQAYLVGAEGSRKEIPLTIKNNCELDLAFTSQITGEIDDTLTVQIQPFAIKKGETKTIPITLTNSIKRTFTEQSERNLTIFLKSDALEKSLPLKIILWDPIFSLNVIDNIVLFITVSEKTENAVAQLPLIISNASTEAISNITIAQGAGIPLNMQNVSLTFYPETAVALLNPNQTILPPIVLTAQSNAGKNAVAKGSIVINGSINGRQFVLREIPVTVVVSAGFEGLMVSPIDPLYYSSETSEKKTLKQRILIKNNTLEPVKIVQTDPSVLGENELVLIPIGTGILAQQQEGEFDLVLIQNQDMVNYTPAIKVKGIGTFTNKPVSSQPFQLTINLGETAVIDRKVSTNPTNIPICEDLEQTKTIQFPLPATDEHPDCSKAYCDAQQLANFLAQKANDQIVRAKQRILNLSNNALSVPACDARKNYCTFTSLGVPLEAVEVYFKNDALGTEMLQETVQKENYPELKNFNIQTRDIDRIDEIAGTMYRSFFAPAKFKGCGKYIVKIEGAVQVLNGEIIPEGISIAAIMVSGRVTTPECENKIQNLMNFLPADKSYSLSDPNGSWLSLVQYPPELKDVSEDFAAALFGTPNRAKPSAQNNKMALSLKEMQGIMKLRIDSTPPYQTKTVYAELSKGYLESSEEKTRKDAAAKAGQAIANLAISQIDPETACIGQNEDYILIKSLKETGDTGKILFKGNEQLELTAGEKCLELTVSSNKNEAMEIKKTLNDELKGKLGEENVFFKLTADGATIETLDLVADNKNGSAEENELEFDETAKLYSKKFFLCANGTGKDIAIVVGIIKVEAQSQVDVLRKAEKQVKVLACGINPVDLMKKVKDLENKKDYFFTPMWKASPDEIALYDLITFVKGLEENKQKPYSGLYSENVSAAGDILSSAESGRRLSGMLKGFLPYCAAACAACQIARAPLLGGVTLITGVGECAFDCGTPIGIAMAKEYGLVGGIWDAIKGAGSQIKDGSEALLGINKKEIEQNWKAGIESGAAAAQPGGVAIPKEYETEPEAIIDAVRWGMASTTAGYGVKSALTKATTTAPAQSKFRQFFNTTKIKGFIGSVGCGLISEAAGYAGWRHWWSEQSIMPNAKGLTKIEFCENTLKKNQSYKITVSTDESGNKLVKICPATSEEISKAKPEQWLNDCSKTPWKEELSKEFIESIPPQILPETPNESSSETV